jgi:hypothetical protein
VKGINDSVSPGIRVDTTRDDPITDSELSGQLMYMYGKVQRSSPQSLGSIFEDIEEHFTDPHESEWVDWFLRSTHLFLIL